MNRSPKLSHVKNPRGRLITGKVQPPRQRAAAPSARSKQPKPRTTAVNSPQNQVSRLHYPNPAWLKSLLALQRVSFVVFSGVFGLSSIVYGYTMHTQTTWRSQQDQLRRWQNQERQQGIMAENIKQQVAITAETKDSGFVDPKPHLPVYVRSANPQLPKSLPARSSIPTARPISKVPLGY